VTASQDPAGGPDGKGPPAGAASPGSAPARPKRAGGRRIRGLEPEQRRQERRRQLLDSAFHLFATQGYARTSIEQICQGAYVGFKGFYDEFATKEALFLTLYEQVVGRVISAFQDFVDHREFTSATVRELLEVFVRAVLDDGRVAQVLFVEAAGLSPAVEAARRATYRTFADFVFAMWSASSEVREKMPADFDHHRLPLGMVGAIVELMVDWLVDSADEDIKGLIDDLEIYCTVVLTGLQASWPA
jgi:AcrR family transcriptional regulator